MTAPFPDDVETMKKHIVARREAIAIMLQENAALTEALKAKIGIPAWIAWMKTQDNPVTGGKMTDPPPDPDDDAFARYQAENKARTEPFVTQDGRIVERP
jgi:hypothetical protein